jgi:hypothetical protein
VDITLGTFALLFEGSSESESDSDSASDANSAVLSLVSVKEVAGAEEVVAALRPLSIRGSAKVKILREKL